MSSTTGVVKKNHHQSACKLNSQSFGHSNTFNRINHSTSFVIAASGGRDSSLDSCPKCGRKVCDHASVADVINLPNSVSQDFSTYSSDSSLIKQLLSESTSSTGTVRSSVNRLNHADYETILPHQPPAPPPPLPAKLSIPMMETTTNLMFSQILTQMSKQKQPQSNTSAAMSNYITFNVLRPVSCQYVLDTETTDKLLKDFFESSSGVSSCGGGGGGSGGVRGANRLSIVNAAKSEKTTQTVEVVCNKNETTNLNNNNKRAKKNKFSNFRLFANKNSSTSSSSSSSSSCKQKPLLLRSTTNAFVNCLTSSSTSSSSSCEEISGRGSPFGLKRNIVRTQQQQQPLVEVTNPVTSPLTDEQKLTNKRIMIDSDAATQRAKTNLNQSIVSLNSKLTNDLYDETDYNELHALELCPIVASDCDDVDELEPRAKRDQKANSLISVKLSNTLTYQYQKKEDPVISEQPPPPPPPKSVSVSTITRQGGGGSADDDDDTITTANTQVANQTRKFIVDIDPDPVEKKFTLRLKNRFSYFSSCSSCNSQPAESDDGDSRLGEPRGGVKYHPISVIFILMGLFTLNIAQETYLLFYYFTTSQFYWLTYALVALFTGQVLTLILSLVAEIELARPSRSVPAHHHNDAQSSSSCSASSTTAAGDLVRLTKSRQSRNSASSSSKKDDIYRVFTSPFTKLALIVPGFLPLCVFAHFLRTLFEYRKSSGLSRFRLEFQLSLYLFLTALFFSLPIAVLNSCYLASITKWGNYSATELTAAASQPVQWYYSELLSVFTASTIINTTSDTSSESTSAESYSRVVNRRQNAALPNELLLHSHAKNQFLLVLISIFISISIGICVFATYHELMKQNYENLKKQNSGNSKRARKPPPQLRSSLNRRIECGQANEQDLSLSGSLQQQQQPDLGLIEILVYFCYRFCLITSRLAVLALICYLFQQWLFIALAAHIGLTYLSSFLCLAVSPAAAAAAAADSTNSRLQRQLSLFVVCLLSFVDLFANQLTELCNFRKIVAYYTLYLVQNIGVSSYWLLRNILEAGRLDGGGLSERGEANVSANRSSTVVKTLSSSSSSSPVSPATTVCYATLVYLCIILFSMFGLILKFLHLHILRKRCRRNV